MFTRSLNASLIAAILTLAATAALRGQQQTQEPDEIDFGALPGLSLSNANSGSAVGEVPEPRVPFGPKTNVPDTTGTPEDPASMDLYSRYITAKNDLEKKTGFSYEVYINPSDQAILGGSSSVINRATLWYNIHLGQRLWTGAQVLMNARGDIGDGVGRYSDTLFNVNQHAGETSTMYISHLFFQQKLFDDRLTISIGKLDLLDFFDENEVASWNLVPYTLARNGSIPAPYHAIGGVIKWDITPDIYVQAGAADNGGNPHMTGFNTVFDNDEPFFTMAEVGFKPKFFDKPGTYRFIFWYNTGDIARFDGNGVDSGDWGAAVSFDQQITDKLSLFFRYGYSNPAVRRMHHYVATGASYRELFPGRTKDVAGLGIAQVFQSDAYQAVNNVENCATQIDLYYKIHVTPWLSITPDLQIIVNSDRAPGGETEVIGGLYGELRF